MPRPQSYEPLRWWEDLVLFFLARSPRIERIVVTQRAPATEDDEDEELDDTHHFPQACAEFLENLYRRSPDQDPGQT